MPTSGKVDKRRLRALYEETFRDKSEKVNATSPSGERIDTFDRQLKKKSICTWARLMSQHNKREQARGVLRDILGLSSTGEELRPRDDEDFYSLGGNSLMAVLALENLRQMGYNIHLETFYETGIIGEILDSDELSAHERSTLEDNESWDALAESRIELAEWTELSADQANVCKPSKEDIIKVLVDSFLEKEILVSAFKQDRHVLRDIAMAFLNNSVDGVVITASCRSPEICEQQKPHLLGVLLSLPVDCMPDLPNDPSAKKLQRFFNFCEQHDDPTDINPANSRALSVAMVGVVGSGTDELTQNPHWSQMSLKLLYKMEDKLLLSAQRKGFSLVETVNTSRATKEVCAELGYKVLKKTTLREFANVDNIVVEPEFLDQSLYYMMKQLKDQ